MDTNQAADSLTFTQRPTGLHDEFEMVRSEFQRAQATLTKSISETMAAVDDFGAKQDRFERPRSNRSAHDIFEQNITVINLPFNLIGSTD
jgi:hypothetical protein